ncbi:SMI1/KNR4 family protein [Paenibacillus gallinarum]|uniref:SMI1/KNR4 family protein n=1 Tax=Paenibacillus gallinarum TaxID=2762232 RepID=A0ABR8T6W4_9BACL|nr:SMI1/KNR4 family protein [Paenibacillus gallinarum]MBD7971355.1 SMI1/KNR4 family protein [Paenibacillus gallinarum]
MVEDIFDELERRTDTEGFIEITIGNNQTWKVKNILNKGASQHDIDILEEVLNKRLPDSYKEFLLLHNGCRLFEHPFYEGENYIYSSHEVIDLRPQIDEHYTNQVRIARILGDNIVLNLDNDTISVCNETSCIAESMSLKCNFLNWLREFIAKDGQNIWEKYT